ncbi:MAG: indolepyruvate oxidoreductase, partial [Bacteroidales bacterium]|nr:indolepyruvate oxidoreductase [Bacteroidales bacterium]
MKTDIILAGVGGQGILTIAAGIGLAAVSSKLYI